MEETTPWYKTKHIWQLGIIIFMLVTTLLLAGWIKERQSLRSEAAADEVILSFNPNTATLTPTAPQTLKLMINPGKAVGFINLELNFDPALIKLNQAVALLEPKFNQVIKLSTPAEANADGKIIITLGLDPGQTAQAPATAFALADIQLAANTANPNLTAGLNFNNPNSQVVAMDTNVFTIISSGAQLTINPQAGPKLFFSAPAPANPQTVNQNFTVTLMANTETQEVSGFDAQLAFDKTKLQILQIDPVSGNGFTSYPVNTFDNTAGTAKVSANIGSGTSTPAVAGNNLNLATLTFKPLAGGDTTLNYVFTAGERNDSNLVKKLTDPGLDPIDILASVDSATINIQPQVVVSPSPSPQPSPSPSPQASPTPPVSPQPSPQPSPSPSPQPQTITLKFGLQGRTRTGISQAKAVTFDYRLTTNTSTLRQTLTTAANGETGLTIAPGSYHFLAKISGYLSRRFGGSSDPVVISPDSQFLDLSGTLILGGDFNNDGIINEVDYTSQFLPKFGSADAIADLDGSGKVNNLDFAIMRLNWNLVNDQL